MIIYQPKKGETLKAYLQRYTVDEIGKIIHDPEKGIEFCKILEEHPWAAEFSNKKTETEYEKIRRIFQNTENYENLLHCIDIWKQTRLKLLDTLAKCSKSLNGISKVCSCIRIFGCAAESICTIWGLLDSKYSNPLLNSATCLGGVGIFTTLAGLSMDTFYEMMNVLQRDQKLFDPISKWYQQNEKAKKAMESLFPFNSTDVLMKEVTDIVSKNERFNFVNLLSRFLKNLTEKSKTNEDEKENEDEKKSGDEKSKGTYIEKIEFLVNLISSPIFKNYCEWIIIQEENQAVVNFFKIFLQYFKSDWKHLVCQNVRALTPADQKLSSLAVYGRICANGYSIASDTLRLWESAVPGVLEMQSLEKHFRHQLEVMDKIVEYLKEENPNP